MTNKINHTATPLRILCISSFFKGEDFMRGAKAANCIVYLLTSKQLEHADWPYEAIEEIFYVQDRSDEKGDWDMGDVKNGMAWLMRSRKIDRIAALDDFDVEKAAELREHFRIDGMGQTTSRFFRDKLAMRVKAASADLAIPPFTPLFNDDEINAYMAQVPAPWLIKPRSEASATGIKKVHNAHEAWEHLHHLGDKRHRFLMEQFRPGDVYHADALTLDGKVIFCRVSRYLDTPMNVAHGGGIFRSAVVEHGGDDDRALQAFNAQVMTAFGMQYSASHTEFIKNRETGQFYFLETSSRVGGANLAEMVEASSGINLWYEWARIEAAQARGEKYQLPKVRKDYAGIVVSLSRFQEPDNACFTDSEIVWRMHKEYHIGLIVQAKKQERVIALLDEYTARIQQDFHASAPIQERPTS